MLLTLVGLLASTSPSADDPSAVVQAEKLRMNVLELREISRSERLRNGGIFTIVGASLVVNAALFFSERRNQFWVSPTIELSQDLSFAVFGALMVGYGVYNMMTPPYEEGLWNELNALRLETSGDRAIFLAEGEARFEASVQRAAFLRKLSGALFIGGALSSFGLHLSAALSAPRPHTGTTPDPLDARNFLAREVVDLAAVAMGLFFIFATRTPSERAWAAYLNDKNLQRPAVIAAPMFLAAPGLALAGARGSF